MLKQLSEPVIDSIKYSRFFPTSVSDYTKAQFHMFHTLDRKKLTVSSVWQVRSPSGVVVWRVKYSS